MKIIKNLFLILLIGINAYAEGPNENGKIYVEKNSNWSSCS